VELVEAHALLQGRVAVDLHVGVAPEGVQVGALFGGEPGEAGLARARKLGAGMHGDLRIGCILLQVARADPGHVLVQRERLALADVKVEGVAQLDRFDGRV
jgi:hypothetical protein